MGVAFKNWKILFEEITKKCDIVEKHRVHTLKMPRYCIIRESFRI